MIVYHGSSHVIGVPEYNGSKKTNDYGYGFYTTESLELAKEWACADNRDGFANSYEFEPEHLKILNLNAPEYNILNWLAILTRYRTYWQNGSIAEEAKDYLQRHFFVDPSEYDVIIGYRADDSYFTFAQDFVAGTISLSKLSEAMRLGKLGEQIVLKREIRQRPGCPSRISPHEACFGWDQRTVYDRHYAGGNAQWRSALTMKAMCRAPKMSLVMRLISR